MATVIADLQARLGMDLSGFVAGIRQAGSEAQKFQTSLQGTSRPVDSLKRSMDDATKGPVAALKQGFESLGQAGTAMLGRLGGIVASLGAIGTAIGLASLAAVKGVREFTAFSTQVRDLAFLSGGTTENVSVLVNGLEAMGVNAGTVEQSIRMMSTAIETGSPALMRLGVSIREASGQQKTALAMFYEVVDALREVRSETERNALARQIFGRGWGEMVPVIQRGSEVIKELGDNAHKMISQNDIDTARNFRMALHEIEEAAESALLAIGRFLLTPFNPKLPEVPTTSRDAMRKLMAGVAEAGTPPQQAPPSFIAPPLADYLASEAAFQRGLPRDTGTAAVDIAGMTARIKYETQLNQLQVQGATAAAFLEDERYEAIKKAIKATEAQTKAELDLQQAQINPKLTTEWGRIENLRVALRQATNAKLLQAEREHWDRERAERIRQFKLQVEEQGRLADEYSILGPTGAATPNDFDEVYRLQAFTEEQERQALVQSIRAAYPWSDESQPENQAIPTVTAPEIAQARVAARQPFTDLDMTIDRLKQMQTLVGGENFDALAESMQSTQTAMQSLINQGIDPADERLVELKQRFTELKEVADMRMAFKDIFSSITSGISTSINGVIQGTQTIGDAFKNMGMSILLSIENFIIKGALTELENALGSLIFGGNYAKQSGGLGGLGGLIGGLVGAFAGGGTVSTGTFAEGGIVTRPTLALMGEKEWEVITPFSKLRGMGGAGVTQNFYVSPGVPETVRREVRAMLPEIRAQALDALIQSSNSGGAVTKAVGRKG